MKNGIYSKWCTIKLKCVISCIAFLLIIWLVFTRVSYLFRSDDLNAVVYNRDRINGIQNVDNVDVIFVGASELFSSCQPFRAWSEYGMTSYVMASGSIQMESVQGLVEEALKYQTPKLLVISMLPFGKTEENLVETGLKYTTNSMDYSITRFKTIFRALNNVENNSEEMEIMPLYFDIASYHWNTQQLGNKTAWEHINNNAVDPYNGFLFHPAHVVLPEPLRSNYDTEERAQLNSRQIGALYSLLEYCKEIKTQIMFIAPFHGLYDTEWQEQYNAIGDIVESYGYPVLNANNYYEELGMNFATDFYANYHTNVLGAEKFTNFICEHIADSYELSDYRAEEGYEDWNHLYEKSIAKDMELREWIQKEIEVETCAHEFGLEISKIEEPWEWMTKVRDDNYTVFMVTSGGVPQLDSVSEEILREWGIVSDTSTDKMIIWSGEEKIYESEYTPEEHFLSVGKLAIPCKISCGKDASIQIDNADYCLHQKGINVVLFDNNYNEILDTIYLTVNDKGELILQR